MFKNIIEETMKSSDSDIRLSRGRKWMVWMNNNWIVFEHKYDAKKVITLYEGDSVREAIKVLMSDEEI
jgi:hypothetical protein